MTKMIKLSLAAAVAVSALTTSATAGSLEDSIKDTTVSGKILVGYNYKEVTSTAGAKTQTNEVEYDLDLTLTTKVNDTVSATVGFQADHANAVRDDSTDASKSNDEAESASDNITLTKLYFTAKTDVATVMVGKQKVGAPFFDDERGDGVVALVPAGPVTVAAAHFTGVNSSISTPANSGIAASTSYSMEERDVSALAVIGTFGPVNASLWYATLSGAPSLAGFANGADAYTVNLAGKFGPVNVDFTHSSAELKGEGTYNYDDETLTKLVVSGAAAGVNFVAGYGFTNDNDGDVREHGVDLTGDNDAKTNFRLDQIVLDNYNDANALLLGASMTFGQTTVGANYLMATINGQNGGVDTDATELDLTVKYAMSKNFSITGLYSTSTIDDNNAATTSDAEDDRMELSLNYKF